MSERFGLITRIKPGSENSASEVSIWRPAESNFHVQYIDDVSKYKVGYWLQYSSDGEIDLEFIYKKLENAKVAVSEREGTIRVTTEVTFPANGWPCSKLLGRVSVTKGTVKPTPGTYLSHLYFLREEEMRLHHQAAWLFVGIVESEESTSSFTNVDSQERPLSPVAAVEPETHTQSSTLSVHVPNRLEECQSFEDLENFVTAFRSHFNRITVDFENLGNRVQDVKIVTLFTTVDGLAVCFSPSYGWCVAKQGLNGFSLSTFTETFQRGTWLSVNIFPSVTEDGHHAVVNWIICPKYNVSAAPFKLFCSNREAELLIMEALAFNHVKQRIANGPTRFVLLDTPMGEVWLPGALECTTDFQMDPLVLCPELCRCGKTSYRQYEHSFKSIDVNLNQSGSAVKSNEYLELDASYGQHEHSIQSFNHESRRLCFVSSSTISEAHRTDNFSRGSFTASTGSFWGSAAQHTERNSFVASLQTPSRSESWDDDEMSKMIKWKESLEASRESQSAFRVPEVEKSVVRSSMEKCVWEDDVNSQYDVSYGDNWDDEDDSINGNETQSLNQSENSMKSIEQCDRDDHTEHRVYYSEEEEPEDVKNGSDPPSSFSGISVAELNELEIHSENEEDITSSDDEVISVDGQQFGNEPPEVESSFIMFD